ncbi:uncharacterized protein LOC143253197 isoform X3 [Tachypleus tridentatus]|uniref:uncharacterized protein LOC143253197 isoform X3 n=1 Tax=Tachypleus tridentatus TaxID=6853 RepID=UPI003FD5E880
MTSQMYQLLWCMTIYWAAVASGWSSFLCPAPRSPVNGEHFIFENGQLVKFRCLPGYRMVGEAEMKCIRGQWSSPTPKCLVVNPHGSQPKTQTEQPASAYDESCVVVRGRSKRITPPPRINNGFAKYLRRVKNINNPYMFIIYQCRANYVFLDPNANSLYCQKQKWVGELPKCVSKDNVNEMREKNKIEVTRPVCKVSNGGCEHRCTEFNRQALCSCYPGFYLNQDKKSCLPKVKNCPKLRSPPNGRIHGSCDNSYKSTCFFSCNEGYKLNNPGSSRRVCQRSGTWSGDTPVCQLITCSPLEPPVNGRLVNYCENSYKSSCLFVCDDGYQLQDSNSARRECLISGSWSGNSTVCQRPHFIYSPPIINFQSPILNIPAKVLLVIHCKGRRPLAWSIPAEVRNRSYGRAQVNSSYVPASDHYQYFSELIISDANYLDTGTYKCVFANSSYYAGENATALNVFVNDDQHLFLPQYSRIYINPQKPIVIPCRLTNSRANVTLYKVVGEHEESIITGYDVHFNPAIGFTLRYPNIYYQGMFLCRGALNDRTEEVVFSLNPYSLDYLDPQVFVYINDTNAQHPVIGGSLTLTCTIYYAPDSVVSIEWLHPGSDNTRITLSDVNITNIIRKNFSFDMISRSLTANDVQYSDEGVYTCRATHRNGRTMSKDVFVKVYDEIYSISEHGSNKDSEESSEENSSSEEDGTFSLQCSFMRVGSECVCPKGYYVAPDKKTCWDINECTIPSLATVCRGACVNTVGSYRCAQLDEEVDSNQPCPKGYRRNIEGFCEIIKRPIYPTECDKNIGCSHTCLRSEDISYCACPAGLRLGSDKKTCYECRKNSYKNSQESEFCIECPPHSHTNGTGKTSLADCLCDPGYSGDLMKNISCTDIDECEENSFGCSHNCVNTPGSVHCTCPLGLELGVDEKSCEDIDECSINNGGCHHQCENTEGSFKCLCQEGYNTSSIDPYQCNDIDECEQQNGGCSHKCVNYNGGYDCTCPEGYHLARDRKTCWGIRCPAFSKPSNSQLHCKIPTSDVNNTENYPVGSICQIKCERGYELQGPETKTCQTDGTWNKELPFCVAMNCPPIQSPEHGFVYPETCSEGKTSVGDTCYFTCEQEYRLVGRAFVKCTRELHWKPKTFSYKCVKNVLEPYVQCPDDIAKELPISNNKVLVYIPQPKSNIHLEYIQVLPAWVKVQEDNEFSAGVTEVIFTATEQHTKKTTSCIMQVEIQDKESPVIIYCPKSFEVVSDTLLPTQVNWTEPIFKDNVMVEEVTKSQDPGTELSVGTHTISYRAKDKAGNFADCTFEIHVKVLECQDLYGLENGEQNCADWIFGKICSPTCRSGYVFYTAVSDTYECSLNGEWTPSNIIPDCAAFTYKTEDGCPAGTELKHDMKENGEICVECPPGYFWESVSAACTTCPTSEYQDEFRQLTCKKCPVVKSILSKLSPVARLSCGKA